MGRKLMLEGIDRDFLQLVAMAAFANPFGEERMELDRRILGGTRMDSRVSEIDAVAEKVRGYIDRLKAGGCRSLRDIDARDRDIVESAFLFDAFHRFLDAFDVFICTQVDGIAPDAKPSFADDALGVLKNCGFSAEEAEKVFGMFYQLRRAYYFVDRALIGRSSSMKFLRRSLWNNVFTHDMRLYRKHMWERMEDFSTLLLGETGTGKGAAAASIGRSCFIPFNSRRGVFEDNFMESFVSLNLSQYPESLIESELFGHRKGAFTGAMEAHEGVFSRCSRHGAIFLDEIGEVSVPIQIKLLQVLQERTFSPVGSHTCRRFQGRVIAATNRSLDELRGQKSFRDDFYYRLCSDVITVPPLRQRIMEDREELADLVKHLVARLVGEPSEEIERSVCDIIVRDVGVDYAWPGNVRELEQCIRRILLSDTYRGDLSGVSRDAVAEMCEKIRMEGYDAEALLTDYCKLLYRRHGTYEDVAKLTNLDRRTVKKRVDQPA